MSQRVEPTFNYRPEPPGPVVYSFTDAYFQRECVLGYEYRFRNKFGDKNVDITINGVFLEHAKHIRTFVEFDKIIVFSKYLLNDEQMTIAIQRKPEAPAGSGDDNEAS